MDALVSNGNSNENKSLGAFYVLSALTLVNNDLLKAYHGYINLLCIIKLSNLV